MLLMKKDMGGAATALALAHMIMGQKLDCRLRVLIPCAENSVSGDAFRPGDVLTSRSGRTVEIGNTDAEGRLVLADALTAADEESPEAIYVFATLTGAARTALGPDLPAFFTDDDAFASALTGRSAAIGDPVWRLPLWQGYRRNLDSDIADMNNVWESPFAGCHNGSTVSAPVRGKRTPFRPLRSLRLASGGAAVGSQGWRAADGARGS